VVRPGVVRVLAGAATVLVLSGCSVFDRVRRDPPPGPVPAASVQAAAPAPRPFRLRSAVAPVPAGYVQSAVEFADVRNGAALFTKCRDGVHDCAAVLLVTADGGVSWQARTHPQAVADTQQLYVGVDGTIVLVSGPSAYFVSTDRARTFVKSPSAPVAYRALAGPYDVCCDADPVPTLRHVDAAGETPVPVAPPLPGRLATVVARSGTDLWTASAGRGGPATAVSTDSGSTWRAVPVPFADVSAVRLLTADSDLWLIGDVDVPGFPMLWRLGAAGWQRLAVVHAPDTYRSVAALGGGLLAVSGSTGTGVVTTAGTYVPTDWPARGVMRPLGDGNLQLRDDLTATNWLGVGAGAEWRWIELDLRT
jgi:hypothetical protein